MAKIYNSIINSFIGNINYTTVDLGNISYYLVPLYVNNPGYLIVMLRHASALNMSLTDSFGHVLTPLLTLYKNDTYLVTYALKRVGNYSLLITVNEGSAELLFSVTSLPPYLLSYLLLLTVIMDLGVISIVLGVAILSIYVVRKYHVSTR